MVPPCAGPKTTLRAAVARGHPRPPLGAIADRSEVGAKERSYRIEEHTKAVNRLTHLLKRRAQSVSHVGNPPTCRLPARRWLAQAHLTHIDMPESMISTGPEYETRIAHPMHLALADGGSQIKECEP